MIDYRISTLAEYYFFGVRRSILREGGVDALLRAAHRHHKKRQIPCCRRRKRVCYWHSPIGFGM